MPAPVAPQLLEGTPATTRTQLMREYKEDVRYYNEALRRNDRAIGTIRSLVEDDQLVHLDGLTSAKQVWDTLKEKHKDSAAGLAAYYIKIGTLEKRYSDESDETMLAHLNFITLENRKLGSKAFDDEFLAQIMLMSLPHNSTWETLVVSLLQSVTDASPLKSIDITARLMQEWRRLTGNTESADSAMAAKVRKEKSFSGKKKKRCGYCKYTGHDEDECRRKKNDEENKGKKGKNTAHVAQASSEDSDDKSTSEKAHLASVFAEFPSHSEQWEDGSHHVFIAAEVVSFLARSSRHETYIDSGCTRHLSPRHEWFNDATYVPLEKPISIHLGDASVIKAIGHGTLQYLMDVPNEVIPASIPDALYVPDLAASLLSIARFTDRDHDVHFHKQDCHIVAPSGRCVAAATKTTAGLYRLLARPMLSKESSGL